MGLIDVRDTNAFTLLTPPVFTSPKLPKTATILFPTPLPLYESRLLTLLSLFHIGIV